VILANLALALAPSLILLWWAYRRDTLKKESVRLLTYAFLLGLLGVVPAIAIGLLTDPFRDLMPASLRIFYQAFIVAALVEEGVKYAVLRGFVRRHQEFDEVTDGIVYGMASSLGFAFLENVLYVGGPTSVIILRGVTAVPLHAGCGALVGYFVGRAHFHEQHSAVLGLVAAVLVHGAYDVLVFSPGLISFASLAVVAGLAVGVPLLFRHAIALDVAAGRTADPPKPVLGS
jgi:RsiW-degrading membrane proteinase PrsW (M82 family)